MSAAGWTEEKASSQNHGLLWNIYSQKGWIPVRLNSLKYKDEHDASLSTQDFSKSSTVLLRFNFGYNLKNGLQTFGYSNMYSLFSLSGLRSAAYFWFHDSCPRVRFNHLLPPHWLIMLGAWWIRHGVQVALHMSYCTIFHMKMTKLASKKWNGCFY